MREQDACQERFSLLSDKKILEGLEKGNIVIYPFNPDNLGSASYDITLGSYFFREQHPEVPLTLFNPYNRNHVEKIWGEPQKAQKASTIMEQWSHLRDWEGISPDDEVILIHPGETILTHTQEFVGGKNGILAEMKARSSLERVFIDACKSAGWGDVGFINRWAMEITNFSAKYTVPLVVGRRYAQMLFFEVGETSQQYHQHGKYQKTDELSELVKSWKPQDLLPKLYLDREIAK